MSLARSARFRGCELERVYEIEGPLGRGGSGSVWKAKVEGGSEDRVALKIFDQPMGSDPEQCRMRELRVALERKGVESIRRKVGKD